MSSPDVGIVDSTALNEFDVNLLSPLSLFSFDEQVEKQAEWSAEQPVDSSPDAQPPKPSVKSVRSKGRASRTSAQKQSTLACWNCRPKKIKVSLAELPAGCPDADQALLVSMGE